MAIRQDAGGTSILPPVVESEKSSAGDETITDHLRSVESGSNGVSLGQAFGCISLLVLFYGAAAWISINFKNNSQATPLGMGAPLSDFSESRAMTHVIKLARDIGDRQEGTAGLLAAGDYLRNEIQNLARLAQPTLRFEIEDAVVSGSFNLIFLERSLTLAYSNLTNLAVRVSTAGSNPERAAILINGHYDSAMGSPGAADCASCVAVMLETLRQVVESNFAPPAPLIFLFNGGEEVFLKAAHGFVSSCPWIDQVGAVINLEATGTRLPDLVVQSGPGDWPIRVYGKSAPYPMATAIAQDIFPHVPGDTDFRIFAQDYGDIPGLDVVYLLNGYAYHTKLDSPENLMPGALQVRGENLWALLDGFGRAPELKTKKERLEARSSGSTQQSATPVFFDLFGRFLVYHSRPVAAALHFSLLGFVVLLPSLASTAASGEADVSRRYADVIKGGLFYAAGIVLALLLPLLLALTKGLASSTFMNWYRHWGIGAAMFGPAAVAGLLIPQVIRARGAHAGSATLSEDAKKRLEWSGHWGGTVGANALICSAITYAGGGSGYVAFFWAAFMAPALLLLRKAQARFGASSALSLLGYLLPAAVPAAFSVNLFVIFGQFLTEKLGASGTLPLPYGPYLPDVALAMVTGLLTALCVAPLMPVIRRWLGHAQTVRILIYVSIGLAALSCRIFPYSSATPKRVVLQRLYWTQGEDSLVKSDHLFATGDANDASFLFQHIPALARELNLNPREPLGGGQLTPGSRRGHMAWYPVSDLMQRTLSAPAPNDTLPGVIFPTIRVLQIQTKGPAAGDVDSRRRIHLELDTGSLRNVWTAVLNFTGPILTWSLADGKLPAAEVVAGGPPSFMVHNAGGGGAARWQFWIESLGDLPIRIELAVLDHFLSDSSARLVAVMPTWVACAASSSYHSSYSF